MLRNYFKISWRTFSKNPLSSFINTLGLSLAIGCCMVGYAFLSMEYNMESQHENRHRTYMVTTEADRDGGVNTYGITPGAIGLQLKEDFPQIKYMTRVWDESVIVKSEENVFREWTRMVEPDFPKMFDFQLIKGRLSSISERENVIINTKIAEKYFGKDEPIGRTILIRFSNGEKVSLNVSAVVEIDQMKTSFYFDFLTNYGLKERVFEDFKDADWSENVSGTFVMLDDPTDIDLIKGNTTGYPAIINNVQKDWEVVSIGFEPVSTLYDRSNTIRWDISRQSDVEGQVVLSIISILMLVLACLNYLNIAISTAVKRLKEIGIRKVIGANRGKLVTQFMVENLFQTFVALIIGVLLGATVFLPGLNNTFGITLGLEVFTLEFYLFLTGLLLLTAIISGAYPSLYISRFQVVSIIKGKLMFGRQNLLSKVFLTLQFVIACMAVSCGVFFTLNTEYIQQHPWGFDKQNTMVVPTPDYETLTTFRNRLEQIPSVEAISTTSHHVGSRVASSVVEFPEQKMEVARLDVDAGYLNTMDMNLVMGRNFRQDYESDKSSVIVNQEFVKHQGWDDPLLKQFTFDSTQYTIIGVVEDFHYWSFWNEINPLFLRVSDDSEGRFLVLKIREGEMGETLSGLESLWLEMFPEIPFDGEYQADVFWEYFRNINGHKIMMISVAVIAMVMTCLGLFGLVGLNISGRMKEFSVRKVLGADNLALARAIGSHFVLFLGLALLAGAPVSMWMVRTFFENIYTVHMPLTYYPILMSLGLILVTVALTISGHLWKVVKANPVDGLRVE